MSYLFDSNILILSATPGLQLQPLLLAPGGTVSAISQVEVLGFHDLTPPPNCTLPRLLPFWKYGK